MTDLLVSEFAEFSEGEVGAEITRRAFGPAPARPRRDLRSLASALASEARLPEDEVLRRFGRYLFARFATLYPVFFTGVRSARELLLEVAPRVHDDLHHLQPTASFPSLRCTASSAADIEVEYRSQHDLAPLAEGLLLGCFDHFDSRAAIRRDELPGAEGYACRFVIRDEGPA
jgi:hypothetical protein